MRGQFVSGTTLRNGIRLDHGYVLEENYDRGVDSIEQLVDRGDAYHVKVFETENNFHINVESGDEEFAAETDFRIQKRSRGLNESIVQTTEDPVMPSECEDPHKAIETYAEYALEHREPDGIKLEDFSWEDELNEENVDDAYLFQQRKNMEED